MSPDLNPDEITVEEIVDAAREPAESTGEQGSYKARPLDDLLKAKAVTDAKKAAGGPVFGMRVGKFVPGGTG